MADTRQICTLDLFAGAGGFSLGFHWAGFKTAAAIDHNPMAVETLDVNFSHHGTKVLLEDLGHVTPKQLESRLRSAGVPVIFDVIVGGPPCQGWSKVGRGKLKSLAKKGRRKPATHDPRNELYKSFLRMVAHFKPRVAVMENVPGMLSHGGQNIAAQVAEDMAQAGYTVEWRLLNASHFGVPQVRERLFFVGVRKDLGLKFSFPEAFDANQKSRFPVVTVRDAIGDLPRIPNGARDWILPYVRSTKLSVFAGRMRQGADQKLVFDHVCRDNKQDLEAFRLLRQGGWYRDLPKRLKRYRDDIFEDKYKKLFANKPSWCITAHLSKDCYTHIHPFQARTISIREAARLQSFPDCFYFAGNMGNKFQLIGNAVPPVLAEVIASAIKEQIFSGRDRWSDRQKTRIYDQRPEVAAL